jgi:hypothetical protein
MKAITKDSINAFMQDTEFKRQNMRVDIISGVATGLYLHDNLIAIKYHVEPKELFISNCGWFSNTTKERLNALPNVHIQQKNFKWFLNGKQWNGKQTKIIL